MASRLWQFDLLKVLLVTSHIVCVGSIPKSDFWHYGRRVSGKMAWVYSRLGRSRRQLQISVNQAGNVRSRGDCDVQV